MTKRTRFRSFSRRLLVRLMLLALIAMMMASIAQVFLISHAVKQQQNTLLSDLTATQIPLLQSALWDIELAALERQLERLVELADVAAVRLQSETGLDMRFGAPTDGSPADTRLVIYSPMDESQQMGELHIHFHKARLAQLIRNSIFQRILEFSLYTLVLFAILFRALYRDIGRPLQLIAEYVATLKPQKNAPRLTLPRRKRDWHDEMDLISEGFDTLHQGMQHYAEQHETAIEQLARERDNLDGRVAERTSELAYLNGYLKLISGTSLKLMHLRKSQYPKAMTQTLQSLGQYLHLDACALLDNEQMRVSWMKEEDPRWLAQFELPHVPEYAPGWSVSRSGERSLVVAFSSPQRKFAYAVRGVTTADVDPERESLLQGVGQWLFSLLQHWDHVIGLEHAQVELLEMSRTDPLTGLANRRHFEQHHLDELHRAQRMGYPVSLLMLDVDSFKAFNDLYGHAEGDACLVSLATLIKSRFKRSGELAARMGGEEFAVLLPGVDLDAAHEAAETLCRAIHDLNIPHEGSSWGRVTASIGYARWSVEQGGDTEQIIDSLMRSADKALYEAKRQGRNKVVAARSAALSGEQ
ncbi:MAG: diguanylate cyclase [Pseudomonas sp.]